jgi:hypothetical protein
VLLLFFSLLSLSCDFLRQLSPVLVRVTVQCWRASAGNDDAKSPEYQHIHITVVGYGMAGKARVRDGQAFSGHFVFDVRY